MEKFSPNHEGSRGQHSTFVVGGGRTRHHHCLDFGRLKTFDCATAMLLASSQAFCSRRGRATSAAFAGARPSTSIQTASTTPFGQIQPRNCMQSSQNSLVQSHGNPSDLGRVHPRVFTLNLPRVNPSVSENTLSENGFFAIHSELTTWVDRSVHVHDMWHVGTSQRRWSRGRKALQREDTVHI